MSETALSRGIRQALTASGYWCWRANSGLVTIPATATTKRQVYRGAKAGTPDIIGALKGGKMFAIEVKRPGEPLRPSQFEWHAKAQRFGVHVGVAESISDALRLVRQWQGEDAERRSA